MGLALRIAVFVLALFFIVSAFYFIPFRTAFVVNSGLLNPLTFSGEEISSPSDRLNSSQIEIFTDKVVIHINNSQLGSFGNTNSMLPLIDEASNGIIIKPQNEQDIHAGDIIAFEREGIMIVHRVTETDTDEEGWYAITKGDNSQQEDGKIRFQDVRYVIIALVY